MDPVGGPRSRTIVLPRRNERSRIETPAEEESPSTDAPTEERTAPSLWTRLDAQAFSRAERHAAEMRAKIEAQLAADGGAGHPQMSEGELQDFLSAMGPPKMENNPLENPELASAAQTALDTAAPVPADDPYAMEKADTRRRLDQLGLDVSSDSRVLVVDPQRSHGEAVTRVLAGETALTQGADVRLDAPEDEAYRAGKEAAFQDTGGIEDPSIEDLASQSASKMVAAVDGMASDVGYLATANAAAGDGRRTFVNMSLGTTPNQQANELAMRMMKAEPDSALGRQARRILERDPRVTSFTLPDGTEGTKFNKEDLDLLKTEAVLPALEAEMARPEFTEAMGDARLRLKGSAEFARHNGVMIFQSAGNEHASTSRIGRNELSEGLLSNVDGIFRVGATQPNGPGTHDDTIADFSSAGPVDASATGEGLPVGKDAEGNLRHVDGTSFASPIMVETALAIDGVNPNLSLQQIEDVLEDPRVAHDIEGTTRDGAGSVDQFAAIMVARHPGISRPQIDRIRAQLDADPNGRFTIGANFELLRVR